MNMSSELRHGWGARLRPTDPCPGGFDVVEQARVCEGARARDGHIMGALARAVPKRSMRVAARTRAFMEGPRVALGERCALETLLARGPKIGTAGLGEVGEDRDCK